ncbi:MAG: beta-galactosidase, partial [Tannerella sp.]|nr:beta-galactosidase [Tannerella sp.]
LTGYPSMEAEYWQKIYRRCKEFGLNHVRFHSWCPPEVAFEIADREGIYLQVECGVWANLGSSIGDGNPPDKWLYAESERIVKEYCNHPSFCMFLHGNEPGGKNHVEFLSRFVDYWKARDPRRVYTSGAGWPYIPNADYWSTHAPRTHAHANVLNDLPPQTAYDWREVIREKTMPVVSHEIGQWCVYPNFEEIPKYTGVLKAKNFEIFRDFLAARHLGDLSGKFLYASGRLQTLCYKAEIEAALRTPGFAGFQLLDLHDFPGQGTALVGVLDPFWDTKGYVDGAEYSRFCNATVPLARMEKLVWTNAETFSATVEVSHFAAKPLPGAVIEWELTDDATKNLFVRGTVTKDLPVDNCIEISRIEYALSTVTNPSRLTLTVRIAGTEYANDWHVWVYPETVPSPADRPYFTTRFDDAIARAQAGASVLFCPPVDALNTEKTGKITVGFTPVFWNTSWFPGQKPNTLGLYCDPSHPALAAFPNDGYSDFQWWDLMKNCAPLLMDDLPPSFRPVVYIIDDWFKPHRLGLLYEAKIGKGKLMVCGADLTRDPDKRPAARQFRRSLEQYMSSDKFNPSQELQPELIKGLFRTNL